MPVSLATERNPFRGDGSRDDKPTMRVPQARVLRALMPERPSDPQFMWPLIARPLLGVKAGYTAISGTVTRALNGIRSTNKTSGDPHLGVLDLGWVEEINLEIVEGISELNYKITPAGIKAFEEFLAAGGKLPPVKDVSVCTNKRFLEK